MTTRTKFRSFSLLLVLAAALALTGGALAESGGSGKIPVPATASSSIGTVVDEADLDEFADYDYDYDASRRNLQTQETTTCNFWCQLKNSLGLTIVGLLLICLAPCFMWKNEGRHVRELRRIDFCKNKAVVVENSDIPSDENSGQLVHFVGEVVVDDAELELATNALNVSQPVPKALIMKRTVSIYQKFEDASSQTQQAAIGGKQTTTTTFTCREDWTPMGPQPERLEHLPEETNTRGIWDEVVAAAGGEAGETAPAAPNMPPNMPPQMLAMLQVVDYSKAPHCMAVSPAAHVGGFGLSEEIIKESPQVFSPDWSPVPAEYVPDAIEGCEGLTKHSDGVLRTYSEGEQPTNGDIMVKYEFCTDGFDCSFVVEQVVAADSDPEVGAKFGVKKADVIDDKCFGKIHDNLGVIWMVRRGRHNLEEMINMAKEEEKQITKLLRILCYILLLAGWVMLFSIFQTFFNTLPILKQLGAFAIFLIAFIVGTACCCGVTALAYFRYRPFISLLIIAIGLGVWGLVAGIMGANGSAPTPAPTPAPL